MNSHDKLHEHIHFLLHNDFIWQDIAQDLFDTLADSVKLYIEYTDWTNHTMFVSNEEYQQMVDDATHNREHNWKTIKRTNVLENTAEDLKMLDEKRLE